VDARVCARASRRTPVSFLIRRAHMSLTKPFCAIFDGNKSIPIFVPLPSWEVNMNIRRLPSCVLHPWTFECRAIFVHTPLKGVARWTLPKCCATAPLSPCVPGPTALPRRETGSLQRYKVPREHPCREEALAAAPPERIGQGMAAAECQEQMNGWRKSPPHLRQIVEINCQTVRLGLRVTTATAGVGSCHTRHGNV
jgi:hypothetical protein